MAILAKQSYLSNAMWHANDSIQQTTNSFVRCDSATLEIRGATLALSSHATRVIDHFQTLCALRWHLFSAASILLLLISICPNRTFHHLPPPPSECWTWPKKTMAKSKSYLFSAKQWISTVPYVLSRSFPRNNEVLRKPETKLVHVLSSAQLIGVCCCSGSFVVGMAMDDLEVVTM